MFCTIMSTTMLLAAIAPKTRAAMPGRSGTLRMEIFAWLRSCVTPVTTACSMVCLLRHERARVWPERGAHVDRDAVFLGELHGPGLEHPRAEARQLEHLVVGDARQLPGVGDDVRVGGIHAVDVGVD